MSNCQVLPRDVQGPYLGHSRLSWGDEGERVTLIGALPSVEGKPSPTPQEPIGGPSVLYFR